MYLDTLFPPPCKRIALIHTNFKFLEWDLLWVVCSKGVCCFVAKHSISHHADWCIPRVIVFFVNISAVACRITLINWQELTEGQIHLAVIDCSMWDRWTVKYAVHSNRPVRNPVHKTQTNAANKQLEFKQTVTTRILGYNTCSSPC